MRVARRAANGSGAAGAARAAAPVAWAAADAPRPTRDHREKPPPKKKILQRDGSRAPPADGEGEERGAGVEGERYRVARWREVTRTQFTLLFP